MHRSVRFDYTRCHSLGLVGTTVFGSAISMSGTVIGDYKNSLYIGNRPYHISKGNIMGVVPGAIIGAGVLFSCHSISRWDY